MLDPVKNLAKVTVSQGYDSNDTSIVLATGHGAELPDPSTDGAFNLTWWNETDSGDPSDDANVEIVRVTARSTDTLTVTRAQEGTSASTKNTASKTYKMVLAPTKKLRDDIETELVKSTEYAKNDGEEAEKRVMLGAMDDFATAIASGGQQRGSVKGDGSIIIDKLLHGDKNDFLTIADGTVQTSTTRTSMCIKPDGTKMYVQADMKLYQYTLSTPYDVTSSSLDGNVSLPATASGYSYRTLRFHPDGSRLYIVQADDTEGIEEFTLTTPWDVTAGITSAGKNFTLTDIVAFDISPNGKELFVTTRNGNDEDLHHYTLKTAWDFSVSTLIDSFQIPDIDLVHGIAVHPSGTRVFLFRATSGGNLINTVTMTKPWDLTTGTFDSGFDFNESGDYGDLFIPNHGTTIYRTQATGDVFVRSLYTSKHTSLIDGLLDVDNLRIRKGAVNLVPEEPVQLTGTGSANSNDGTLTGVGTAFTTEVLVGDLIYVKESNGVEEVKEVTSIASDTSLEIDQSEGGFLNNYSTVNIFIVKPILDTMNANGRGLCVLNNGYVGINTKKPERPVEIKADGFGAGATVLQIRDGQSPFTGMRLNTDGIFNRYGGDSINILNPTLSGNILMQNSIDNGDADIYRVTNLAGDFDVIGNSGASFNLPWHGAGYQAVTLTSASVTVGTQTAPSTGNQADAKVRLNIIISQDATGGRDFTPPANWNFPNGEPVWTAGTANQRMMVDLIYDAGNDDYIITNTPAWF